jgi:hypothetical protein
MASTWFYEATPPVLRRPLRAALLTAAGLLLATLAHAGRPRSGPRRTWSA